MANNLVIAADTSSRAGGTTPVVDGAAAAMASLIAPPMPLKSSAAEANAAGAVIKKDDILGSNPPRATRTFKTVPENCEATQQTDCAHRIRFAGNRFSEFSNISAPAGSGCNKRRRGSFGTETKLRDLRLTVGQFVTTWHGARVGQVVKVNKVTVKVRMIGGRDDRNAVVEKNLDPRYVELAPNSLPAPPKPGSEVVVRDHGGYVRAARVIETDGPLFEATYSLKSGQWRSGWFDVAAIQRGEGQS